MVSKIRSVLTFLFVFAALCLTFTVTVAAADGEYERVSDVILSAKTDFTVSISAEDINAEGLLPASYAGYSSNKGAYYIYAMRSKCCVIKFAEPIDTDVYGVIVLRIGKNISSDTTFAFYKNQSGTVAPADTVICKTLDAQNFSFAAADYANAEGKVDSIIVQHLTDKSSEDNAEFQAFVYGVTLSSLEDYTLSVTAGDVDMTDGGFNARGATAKTFIVNTPTEKLFCNEFYTGCAAQLKFETAINTRFYKTLALNLLVSGLSDKYTFYLAFYDTSVTDISRAQPKAKASVTNSTDTVIELNLKDFADENGMVTGINIYHYANTRAEDYKKISLWIFASEVLTRPAAERQIKWPLRVVNAEYVNDYRAGNNLFILTFETDVFTGGTAEITDGEEVDAIAKNIRVNNVRTFDSGELTACIYGFGGENNRMGFLFSSDIRGDGRDRVSFGSGLPISVENVTYLLKTDYEYAPVYNANGTPFCARTFGEIQYVSAEYYGQRTEIKIFFDTETGDIADGVCNLEDKIELNGVKISESQALSCESEGNAIKITAELSSGILNNDGSDVIAVKGGLIAGNFYLKNTATFTQYAQNSPFWYLETDAPLEVYYVRNFTVNNGAAVSEKYAAFEIKFSRRFAGEEFTANGAAQFDKILFNGESLNAIIAEEIAGRTYRAKIVVSGDIVKVQIPLDRVTGEDVITVKSGFTLPQGGTVTADSAFSYDKLYGQFSAIADRSLIPYSGVAVTLVETDTMNDSLTSLFFRFGAVVSEGYIILGVHESELSEELANNPAMDLKDAHVAQFARYGVIESTLDYIIIDGESVRDILQKDKDAFGSFKNTVKINYHGTGFNRGYAMSLSISDGSLGVLDPETTHSVTLKKGFVTAALTQITEDITYYYNTTTGKWQTRPFSVEEEPESKGCSGAFTGDGAVILTALTVLTAVIAAKRRKER